MLKGPFLRNENSAACSFSKMRKGPAPAALSPFNRDCRSSPRRGSSNAMSSAFGKLKKRKEDRMVKLIRALLGFFGLSDNDLITRALVVVKGLKGNSDLSKPPYSVEEFQA